MLSAKQINYDFIRLIDSYVIIIIIYRWSLLLLLLLLLLLFLVDIEWTLWSDTREYVW